MNRKIEFDTLMNNIRNMQNSNDIQKCGEILIDDDSLEGSNLDLEDQYALLSEYMERLKELKIESEDKDFWKIMGLVKLKASTLAGCMC